MEFEKRIFFYNELNKFQQSLTDFFQPLISGNDTNSFEWSAVTLFVKTHRQDMLSLSKLVVFSRFFIDILRNFNCNNLMILRLITDLITVVRSPSFDYTGFYKCTKTRHLCYITRKLYANKEESYYEENDTVQVMSALRSADFEFMQILAKYGQNGDISEDSSFHRKIAKDLIKIFLLTIDRRSSSKRSYREDIDAEYLLGKSKDFLKRSAEDTPSFKRVLITLLGLNSFSWNLQGSWFSSNYIKGLKIYLETIPEPYLTIHEARSLLAGYLHHINRQCLLDSLNKEFLALMPESERNYEPRSLSHLSRCMVRSNLKKNGVLPVAVGNMQLPRKIKKLILCSPEERQYFL